MTNQVFATCLLFLAIGQCSTLVAEEPPSRLHLGISAWLRRQPIDDDSWKGRKEFPYVAVISNASDDPNLSQFVTGLRRFTMFKSSEWPGKGGDYLESLTIENTALTPDQARQLEPLATGSLTISNCDISDDVAQALGGIRVAGSLTLKRLRMSDRALISLGRIECVALTLEQLQLSNEALAGFLACKKLRELHVSDIHGCTADGWRGLSNRAYLDLILSDSDFDDQALLHLSSIRCVTLQVKNAQLTGSTLGSLITQRDCLSSLTLSGCPINDEGLQTLPEFSKLQVLDLSRTLVTDEGFRNFKVSPDLRIIKVTSTKVTKAWGEEFTGQHLGNLRVSFEDDPRWPPHGAYCGCGIFLLYK